MFLPVAHTSTSYPFVNVVENNWHNQTVDGGCAMAEHKATCPENPTLQNNVLVKASD